MTETPPPAQPQQQDAEDDTALYSADDLGAVANAYGCYPWDVAGIFSRKNVTMMTIPDFQAALLEWQQPLPITEGA